MHEDAAAAERVHVLRQIQCGMCHTPCRFPFPHGYREDREHTLACSNLHGMSALSSCKICAIKITQHSFLIRSACTYCPVITCHQCITCKYISSPINTYLYPSPISPPITSPLSTPIPSNHLSTVSSHIISHLLSPPSSPVITYPHPSIHPLS